MQERHRPCTNADKSARSPRGADHAMKSPHSPRGPDCEKPAAPALSLQHLAHASNADAAAYDAASNHQVLAVAALQHLMESPRTTDSPRAAEMDEAGVRARVVELERKLKNESKARRADQLAMMDHIKSASMEKLKLGQQLVEQASKVDELQRQLLEVRFRRQRSEATTHNSTSPSLKTRLQPLRSSEPTPQHAPEPEPGAQNFLASLLGVFSRNTHKPQPPTPGMDSPRGERISGAPVQEQWTVQSHNAASASSMCIPSSPSLAFPLEPIAEASPRSPGIDGEHDAQRQAAVPSYAPGGSEAPASQPTAHCDARGEHALSALQWTHPLAQQAHGGVGTQASARGELLEGERRRAVTLGGGTHSSMQSERCRVITPDCIDKHVFDPLNLDWRVTL